MKKIVFLFALILAISIASNKQYAQNGTVEKFTKQSIPINSGEISSSGLAKSKTGLETDAHKKAPKGKPQILLLLINDTGQAKWSPALWWNYQHANPVQTGC